MNSFVVPHNNTNLTLTDAFKVLLGLLIFSNSTDKTEHLSTLDISISSFNIGSHVLIFLRRKLCTPNFVLKQARKVTPNIEGGDRYLMVLASYNCMLSCKCMLSCIPPTLTAQVDRLLGVSRQNGRPVAHKMRNNCCYHLTA